MKDEKLATAAAIMVLFSAMLEPLLAAFMATALLGILALREVRRQRRP